MSKPKSSSLVPNPLPIDAAPVVADGDDEPLLAIGERPQSDFVLRVLSGRRALLDRLKTVIDGVAHHVRERCPELGKGHCGQAQAAALQNHVRLPLSELARQFLNLSSNPTELDG